MHRHIPLLGVMDFLIYSWLSTSMKRKSHYFLVVPPGLEPGTYWLWVSCSNRLSYRTFIKKKKYPNHFHIPLLFGLPVLRTVLVIFRSYLKISHLFWSDFIMSGLLRQGMATNRLATSPKIFLLILYVNERCFVYYYIAKVWYSFGIKKLFLIFFWIFQK